MIRTLLADITRLPVDAIVNTANTSLLGGGGVDGAIHRAAGPSLLEECRRLHGRQTGEAKITSGYALPCRQVIHTVGPVWKDGMHGKPALRAAYYCNSLRLAHKHGLRSIAFPCISTWIYRFPQDTAARIAVQTVRKTLGNHPDIREVVFCCFDEVDLTVYQELL